nr:hypothetical protein [Babesia bovis]
MPAHKPSKPAVVEPKDPIDELIDFEPPKPCNEDPIVPVDSVFNPAQGITNMDINQEMIEVNLHCRKILRQLCEVLPTEVLCKLPPISTIKLPLYLAIHLYDKEDADELSFGLRKQVARYLANVAADNLKTESGAPASNLEKVHHSNGLFTSIVVHWM